MCRGRCRCGLQVFGSVPRRDADVHQVLSSDGRGCPLRQRPALLHQDLQQVTHIQGLGGRGHSGRSLCCPALLRMLNVSATPLSGRSVLPPCSAPLNMINMSLGETVSRFHFLHQQRPAGSQGSASVQQITGGEGGRERRLHPAEVSLTFQQPRAAMNKPS